MAGVWVRLCLMSTRPDSITRLDYCQYLLSSQINFTLTNFAEHNAQFSHDAINRYLAGDQITPRLVWENVQAQVVQVDDGCLVFDDTVIDKNFSQRIELVRRQYSALVQRSLGPSAQNLATGNPRCAWSPLAATFTRHGCWFDGPSLDCERTLDDCCAPQHLMRKTIQ